MSLEKRELPPALDGQRCEIHDPRAGLLSYYTNGPAISNRNPASPDIDQTPLLLLHSINAAASAHEVKPLYDHYSGRRPVYALDLPGYGFSDRSERPYVPDLMVDAVSAMVSQIRSEHGNVAIDALAVSLSCEFLARAATADPQGIRSLALVSSTGFRQTTATQGPPEANRGRPWLYRMLTFLFSGRPLFRLLTSRPSIGFFLRKTWGRKETDEDMLEYACLTARVPGAHRAPFHFLSGYLTSADIPSIFRAIRQPTWLAHGVRGDFTDFSRTDIVEHLPNWQISVFQTGALPYFEVPQAFTEAYDDFLEWAKGKNQPE